MPHQTPKKSKGIKRVLIAATLLIIAGVVTLSVLTRSRIILPAEMVLKDANGQIQSLLSIPFSRLRLIWEAYVDLQNVKEENQVLKAQLDQLEREITSYREALIENRRLRQLLEMKEALEWKTVVARVVGSDIAPWRAVLTIDAGKRDGITEDMPVLCQGGLIGRVIETSMSYSKVMLLTDYHSRIGAIVQRNRARGILKGDGSRGCVLDYVKKGVDVQVGDTIITSGLDGIFPKGLLLGKVKLVGPGDRSDLFQFIAVEPSARIEETEEVLVLKSPSSGTRHK